MIHLQIPNDINIENCDLSKESLVIKDPIFTALSHSAYLENSQKFVDKIPSDKKQMVVIGIGGSFLGAKCILDALRKNRKVQFWNSVDPDTLSDYMEIDFSSTYFVIISKSGGTTETLFLYNKVIEKLIEKKLSMDSHLGIVTEKNDGFLDKEAQRLKVNFCEHPKDIGGRFSILSPVSFIPALYSGVDIHSLLKGVESSFSSKFHQKLYAFIDSSHRKGKWLQIIWPYTDRLFSFSNWWAQLWSESLGKKTNTSGEPAPRISVPYICYSSIDQHSLLQQFMEGENDNFYLFIKQNNQELVSLQAESNIEAMTEKNFSLAYINIDKINEESFGELVGSFLQCLFLAAQNYGIDPFGQPGVEFGKQILKTKLNKAKDIPTS